MIYQEENWGRRGYSLCKEIIAESFPNPRKDLDIQVHETSRIPYYLNAKKTFFETHYNETVKNQWLKRKNSKGIQGKKERNLQRNSHYTISRFTCQERAEWHIHCWENKNCQPALLCLQKLAFRYKGKIKAFLDKQKLRGWPPLGLLCKKKCWKEFSKLKWRY